MTNTEKRSLSGGVTPKSNTSANETCKTLNALVQVKNNQVVTSSLIVAEHFGKKHKDVLRAIKALDCSGDFTERNFAPCMYISELQNGVKKQNPLYYLTCDGFTFLAMGFTGKIAARFKEEYINAFNDMEQALRENDNVKYVLDLLEDGFKHTNQHLRQKIHEIKKEYGRENNITTCDLAKGYTLFRDMSVESCIRNLVARVNNSTLQGWYFFCEHLKYKRRAEELEKVMRQISTDLFAKFRVFPEQ